MELEIVNEMKIPTDHEGAMSLILGAAGVTTLSYEEAITIYLRARGLLNKGDCAMTGIDEATPRPATIRQRLETLADWFDAYDDKRGYSGDREVQRDLRADANTFSEREALLREAVRVLTNGQTSDNSAAADAKESIIVRIRTALGESGEKE